MAAIITTPEEITDILYEGHLEPDTLLGGPPGPPGIENWPTVVLGQPISLGKFGVHLSMPKETKALLEQNDYCYYLVRLACSFRPPLDGRLTWASLSAYLRPALGDAPVIALDLFPKEVVHSHEGEVTVEVKPGLSLVPVGTVGVGIGTVIKYSHLEPIIIGTGAQRSDPGWEFRAHKDHPLWGSRFLYLIIRKPRQAEAVRTVLRVAARAEMEHGLFGLTIRHQDTGHLSSVICAD